MVFERSNPRLLLLSPQRSLMVSPKNTKTATPSPFTPTVFIIDSKIDSNTITSTMKNGILEIVGKKVKPMVDKMTLPIIEEVSIEDEAGKEEKEAEEVSDDCDRNCESRRSCCKGGL